MLMKTAFPANGMIRTAKNPANLRGDCCSIFQIVSNTMMPTFSGVQSAVECRHQGKVFLVEFADGLVESQAVFFVSEVHV